MDFHADQSVGGDERADSQQGAQVEHFDGLGGGRGRLLRGADVAFLDLPMWISAACLLRTISRGVAMTFVSPTFSMASRNAPRFSSRKPNFSPPSNVNVANDVRHGSPAEAEVVVLPEQLEVDAEVVLVVELAR